MPREVLAENLLMTNFTFFLFFGSAFLVVPRILVREATDWLKVEVCTGVAKCTFQCTMLWVPTKQTTVRGSRRDERAERAVWARATRPLQDNLEEATGGIREAFPSIFLVPIRLDNPLNELFQSLFLYKVHISLNLWMSEN